MGGGSRDLYRGLGGRGMGKTRVKSKPVLKRIVKRLQKQDKTVVDEYSFADHPELVDWTESYLIGRAVHICNHGTLSGRSDTSFY